MPSPYSGNIFSFAHNWNETVVERLSWLTAVLRKRDGSEQRFRLRQQPRRVWEYVTMVGGADEIDERRRFDALIWSGQDKEVMVPFWPDAVLLSAQLNSGASTINTLPKLDGYDIDNSESYLMFWRSYNNYEVVKVTNINAESPGNLSFETNTTKTWPIGTYVVPARRCLHSPSLSTDVFASDINSSKISFSVIIPTTGATQGYRRVSPSLDTYRSTPVYNDPGMNGANTRTVDRIIAPLDFQVGQFDNDSIQTAPFGSLDCNFSLAGRDEIAGLLGWLYARNGRQKGFWLPSYEQDFGNVTRTGASTFTADSFGYTARYQHIESRRDVAFLKADGTRFYRRITGSTDDGTTETFTVDSALPNPIPALDRASFLRYLRLDQDDVELQWQTTDDVSTQLRVRELIKTA